MQQLFNLSIRTKINIIAILGALGFVIYLSISYFQGSQTQSQLNKLEHRQLPVLEGINNASLDMLQLKTFLSVAISSSESSMVDNAELHHQNILTVLNKIKSLHGKFAQRATDLLNKQNNYWQQAKQLTLGMINETVDYDNLAKLSQQMNKSFALINDGLSELRKDVNNEFKNTIIKTNNSNKNGLVTGLYLGVIMIFILLIIAHFISANIKKHITDVTQYLNEMSSGNADLTKRLAINSQDEIGDLIAAFNGFMGSMELLIGRTVTVSKKVTLQAEQLHNLASETQHGIVEQQQEIQLVATAVTELSASSAEAALNADDSSNLTHQASEETTNSAQIVAKNRSTIANLAHEVDTALNVIDELHNKTTQIGSMVDVIRGIADQTNLLALNAAIEAARAGEQGRGFAVVADEVRSLANSTQESTVEIESIIKALQIDATNAVKVMKKGSEQASVNVEQSKLVEQTLTAIQTLV